MIATASCPLMTTEQLLALPENGKDQWLIRGQLREKPHELKDRWHSSAMARFGYLIENWRKQQPSPRGAALSGGATCCIRRNPDSTLGIDVVYLDPIVARQQTD